MSAYVAPTFLPASTAAVAIPSKSSTATCSGKNALAGCDESPASVGSSWPRAVCGPKATPATANDVVARNSRRVVCGYMRVGKKKRNYGAVVELVAEGD